MPISIDQDVKEEFVGSALGDPRRDRRLLMLAEAMDRSPGKSFPEALSPAGLEGAYRFFSNPKVGPGAVLGGHVEQTLERIREVPMCLVLHDSSIISFNSEGYREGLVSTGTKQQFVMHCSLAVAADGHRTPLGVLAASYHVPLKTREGRHQERWGDHVREVHALGLTPDQVVHVMDREADDYEVLALMESVRARFVVRVQHNRMLLDDERLRDRLANAPLVAERDVKLSRRAGKQGSKQRKIHPPREGRSARLAIGATTVTIPRPSTASTATALTLSLHLIHVWEPDPPEGEAPVEWLLYTTEPIDTPEQILRVVDWYRARWTIEEYFKALKSGCAIETRQLGDLHALTNAVALFLPIAWRLLLLKSEARTRPDAPATDILDQDEIDVLRAAGRTRLAERPSVHDAMLAIAALGGHLKHNGAPGWKTLAHGYMRLRSLAEGWRLHRAAESGTLPRASDQS
jgi:hypothetical protein